MSFGELTQAGQASQDVSKHRNNIFYKPAQGSYFQGNLAFAK
jgi:hypothetical protein